MGGWGEAKAKGKCNENSKGKGKGKRQKAKAKAKGKRQKAKGNGKGKWQHPGQTETKPRQNQDKRQNRDKTETKPRQRPHEIRAAGPGEVRSELRICPGSIRHLSPHRPRARIHIHLSSENYPFGHPSPQTPIYVCIKRASSFARVRRTSKKLVSCVARARET